MTYDSSDDDNVDYFSYKKISKCYDHITRILATLAEKNNNYNNLNNSVNLKDAIARPD